MDVVFQIKKAPRTRVVKPKLLKGTHILILGLHDSIFKDYNEGFDNKNSCIKLWSESESIFNSVPKLMPVNNVIGKHARRAFGDFSDLKRKGFRQDQIFAWDSLLDNVLKLKGESFFIGSIKIEDWHRALEVYEESWIRQPQYQDSELHLNFVKKGLTREQVCADNRKKWEANAYAKDGEPFKDYLLTVIK